MTPQHRQTDAEGFIFKKNTKINAKRKKIILLQNRQNYKFQCFCKLGCKIWFFAIFNKLVQVNVERGPVFIFKLQFIFEKIRVIDAITQTLL